MRVSIEIDPLTESELIDLNRKIVERLRLLHQMRAHRQMLEFRIGDRVTFQADGRGTVEGMLTRYNRKSVTVITDDGHHWNVSPAHCQVNRVWLGRPEWPGPESRDEKAAQPALSPPLPGRADLPRDLAVPHIQFEFPRCRTAPGGT